MGFNKNTFFCTSLKIPKIGWSILNLWVFVAAILNDALFFKNSYLWTIPFTYKEEGMEKGQLLWFNTSKSSVSLPYSGENTKWFIANLDFMGYYRINYDTQGWMNIIAQLKKDHTVFSATERAAFIFDSFTFARLVSKLYRGLPIVPKSLFKIVFSVAL